MRPFSFSTEPIDTARGRATLADPQCGGYATFEGWVRNHNEGRDGVLRLEYEGYEQLGVKEGERIIVEALDRFDIANARCIHRLGRRFSRTSRCRFRCLSLHHRRSETPRADLEERALCRRKLRLGELRSLCRACDRNERHPPRLSATLRDSDARAAPALRQRPTGRRGS